jgi:hypothetical protein
MYPSSVQHLNLKYIVLRAIPKIKNSTRFERCITHISGSKTLSFLCRVEYNIF